MAGSPPEEGQVNDGDEDMFNPNAQASPTGPPPPTVAASISVPAQGTTAGQLPSATLTAPMSIKGSAAAAAKVGSTSSLSTASSKPATKSTGSVPSLHGPGRARLSFGAPKVAVKETGLAAAHNRAKPSPKSTASTVAPRPTPSPSLAHATLPSTSTSEVDKVPPPATPEVKQRQRMTEASPGTPPRPQETTAKPTPSSSKRSQPPTSVRTLASYDDIDTTVPVLPPPAPVMRRVSVGRSEDAEPPSPKKKARRGSSTSVGAASEEKDDRSKRAASHASSFYEEDERERTRRESKSREREDEEDRYDKDRRRRRDRDDRRRSRSRSPRRRHEDDRHDGQRYDHKRYAPVNDTSRRDPGLLRYEPRRGGGGGGWNDGEGRSGQYRDSDRSGGGGYQGGYHGSHGYDQSSRQHSGRNDLSQQPPRPRSPPPPPRQNPPPYDPPHPAPPHMLPHHQPHHQPPSQPHAVSMTLPSAPHLPRRPNARAVEQGIIRSREPPPGLKTLEPSPPHRKNIFDDGDDSNSNNNNNAFDPPHRLPGFNRPKAPMYVPSPIQVNNPIHYAVPPPPPPHPHPTEDGQAPLPNSTPPPPPPPHPDPRPPMNVNDLSHHQPAPTSLPPHLQMVKGPDGVFFNPFRPIDTTSNSSSSSDNTDFEHNRPNAPMHPPNASNNATSRRPSQHGTPSGTSSLSHMLDDPSQATPRAKDVPKVFEVAPEEWNSRRAPYPDSRMKMPWVGKEPDRAEDETEKGEGDEMDIDSPGSSPAPVVENGVEKGEIKEDVEMTTSTTTTVAALPRKIRKFVGSSHISEYQLQEKLGEGTFGLVFKGVRRPKELKWVGGDEKEREREVNDGEVERGLKVRRGDVVALKEIILHNEQDGMPITSLREIRILKTLDHPAVVPVVDIAYDKGDRSTFALGKTYMVFPYMDHDLAGLLENHQVKLLPEHIKQYSKQLLEGTHYLHSNGILHRDMKAANLLINNQGQLMIADFGLARSIEKVQKGRSYTNMVVTRWYRPPELLLGETRYHTPVDMWGVGCVIAEMFHRRPIFPGSSDYDQAYRIFQKCGAPTEANMPGASLLPGCEGKKASQFDGSFQLSLLAKDWNGSEFINFLERILILDPKKRMTASEALDHQWLWQDPLPTPPHRMPTYTASHEFDKRKREEAGAQQRVAYPPPVARPAYPPGGQQGQPPPMRLVPGAGGAPYGAQPPYGGNHHNNNNSNGPYPQPPHGQQQQGGHGRGYGGQQGPNNFSRNGPGGGNRGGAPYHELSGPSWAGRGGGAPSNSGQAKIGASFMMGNKGPPAQQKVNMANMSTFPPSGSGAPYGSRGAAPAAGGAGAARPVPPPSQPPKEEAALDYG